MSMFVLPGAVSNFRLAYVLRLLVPPKGIYKVGLVFLRDLIFNPKKGSNFPSLIGNEEKVYEKDVQEALPIVISSRLILWTGQST